MAKLTNKTKSLSKSLNLEVCDTQAKRLRGLMFRQSPANLYFKFPSYGFNPIHSFFVKFEFDAVYLNSKNEAVDIIRKIPPNLPYIEPRAQNTSLLELIPKITDDLNIQINDRLEIKWED